MLKKRLTASMILNSLYYYDFFLLIMNQMTLDDAVLLGRQNRVTELYQFIIDHVPKEKRTGKNKKQILCDFLWHEHRIDVTPRKLAIISNYDRGLRELADKFPDLICDENGAELESAWRNSFAGQRDQTAAVHTVIDWFSFASQSHSLLFYKESIKKVLTIYKEKNIIEMFRNQERFLFPTFHEKIHLCRQRRKDSDRAI